MTAHPLMGAQEVAKRLGVSRQRVQQLVGRPDWPEPYDRLAMGKVWRRADIEQWISHHRPSAAAPPTTASSTGGSRPPSVE